jgi:hypothetical protein
MATNQGPQRPNRKLIDASVEELVRRGVVKRGKTVVKTPSQCRRELAAHRRRVERQLKEEDLERVPDVVNTACSLPMKQAIVEVIRRLPRKVRDYVLDECCFVTAAGHYAQILPMPLQTWLIVLQDELYSQPRGPGSIAHEIAHAYLKHAEPCDLLIGRKQEEEACKLAKKWGFSGSGADPKYFGRQLDSELARRHAIATGEAPKPTGVPRKLTQAS